MHDLTEVDRPDALPRPSSGLTFPALLLGALLVAVLLGKLAGPGSSHPPRADVPPTTLTPTAAGPTALGPTTLTPTAGGPTALGPTALAPTIARDLTTTPQPNKPIGTESLQRCRVQVGGLTLRDPLRVPGWSLERWDCDAPKGPWSVVIRGTGGHFGVHGAVVTYPVDQPGAGTPATKPRGAMWNPDAQRLVWPLAGSHAQITGDVGQEGLAKLATGITVKGGKPHLTAVDGFATAATIPYRSAVVHEIRYGADDLGKASALGDGVVFTGVMSGASFESLAYEARATPAGLVRGKPATYSEGQGGSGILAWELAVGEVTYIGYSGAKTSAAAIEALRALADQGRPLTPIQWQTKDRIEVGPQSG